MVGLPQLVFLLAAEPRRGQVVAAELAGLGLDGLVEQGDQRQALGELEGLVGGNRF
jgi:hypothetical protein